jgi:hypothetical protein
MLIYNTEVVDRNNRPNVSQIVGLRTFFINDGAYVDPHEISSVKLFKQNSTLSPKTVLGADNLVSSVPLMAYGNGTGVSSLTSFSGFDVSNYSPDVRASGIYKIKKGEYAVVLDQTLDLSGWDFTTSSELGASSLSAVWDYVDLWTVKLTSASKSQVLTNVFNLYEDTFFAFTEPILLTTRNKLINKHVRLGEKINLKINTATTIANKDIDQTVQNIFKDSCITSGAVEIRKVNQDPAFAGPFTVSSYADTSSTVDITKDNTLLWSWDTSQLSSLTEFTNGTFGSITGTYSVQVKYTLLNETVISPLFYLTVS